MNIKLTTTVIAAASVMASSSLLADGHGSDAIKTALKNSQLSFEAYGAYSDRSLEIAGEPDIDNSDFDFDKLRLGLNGILKENVSFGFELEWLLNNAEIVADNGNFSATENDLRVNDLFLERSFGAGSTVVTLGRYKQYADRQNQIEMKDRVFTYNNPNVYGAIGTSFVTIVDDFTPEDFSLLARASLGADRRVDGLGIRHANSLGLHASFNIYKGGLDSKNDGTFFATNEESSRNYGYTGSIGWQGGSDSFTLGVTLAAFQEDGLETKSPIGNVEIEDAGASFEAIIAAGPFAGGLNYGDTDLELENSVPPAFIGATPLGKQELSVDAISLWGVFNISNAERNFNPFGVLQGPKVNSGDFGFEAGFQYSMGDLEFEHNNNTAKADQESWGLAFNMYCGSYTKWSLEYNASEFGENSEIEIDTLSIGGRISF